MPSLYILYAQDFPVPIFFTVDLRGCCRFSVPWYDYFSMDFLWLLQCKAVQLHQNLYCGSLSTVSELKCRFTGNLCYMNILLLANLWQNKHSVELQICSMPSNPQQKNPLHMNGGFKLENPQRIWHVWTWPHLDNYIVVYLAELSFVVPSVQNGTALWCSKLCLYNNEDVFGRDLWRLIHKHRPLSGGFHTEACTSNRCVGVGSCPSY